MSTLHTTDAKETVNRIIDFFPPHEQKQVRLGLAASLRGIVCQRLCPRPTAGARGGDGDRGQHARIEEAVADPDKTDTIEEIIASGGYSGMQTFDQHLLQLVLGGTVSIGAPHGLLQPPLRGHASGRASTSSLRRRCGVRP